MGWMMAGMLTQLPLPLPLPLPLLPAGAAEIAPGVGLGAGAGGGGGLVSVHGLATFAWDAGDEAGGRLAAVQLVRLRAVSQAVAAVAFGVDPVKLAGVQQCCQSHIIRRCRAVAGLGPGRCSGSFRTGEAFPEQPAEFAHNLQRTTLSLTAGTRLGVHSGHETLKRESILGGLKRSTSKFRRDCWTAHTNQRFRQRRRVTGIYQDPGLLCHVIHRPLRPRRDNRAADRHCVEHRQLAGSACRAGQRHDNRAGVSHQRQ